MDTFITINGVARPLGWVPPSSDNKKMRATKISLTSLRKERGLDPLIPEKDWVEKDFVKGFSLELITNQLNFGACTAFAGVGAETRIRYMKGFPWEPLSGFFVYDQINGGRDQGSNIIDCMNAIIDIGAPPLKSYPKPKFKSGLIPPGVPMYKETIHCTLDDSAECATALQMNILPEVPICVSSRFESFDSYGVAGLANSRNGNHAVYLAGMKKINGKWFFIMVNSWGLWGPWKNGTCLLSRAHIDNCASEDDSFGHAGIVGIAA